MMSEDQKQDQSEDRGGSEPKYSPNDDRSITKNPTSERYKHDQENQKKQKGAQ